ncbi:MAG: DUF1961 family protein [Planctomycetota bacterium]|jgi:hypothetical protein
MWTQQEFSGSYTIGFEYFPVNRSTGGTFLQLCGTCINPIDHFDFMASAMGSMAYYNYGIPCYHLSFNRCVQKASHCNFRKTGKGFYVLSRIPEPVKEKCWHQLHFVKNGNQFLFFVNDKLVLEYFDEGHQGAVYKKGRIGISE